jgi:hypothetical protein
MAFSIFREIRLSLLIGCDYRDYHNFFRLSDNRDYRDNRDYHLYEIDRNNPWSFDETRFTKHFAKQEGRLGSFAVFSEGTEDCRGERGP